MQKRANVLFVWYVFWLLSVLQYEAMEKTKTQKEKKSSPRIKSMLAQFFCQPIFFEYSCNIYIQIHWLHTRGTRSGTTNSPFRSSNERMCVFIFVIVGVFFFFFFFFYFYFSFLYLSFNSCPFVISKRENHIHRVHSSLSLPGKFTMQIFGFICVTYMWDISLS